MIAKWATLIDEADFSGEPWFDPGDLARATEFGRFGRAAAPAPPSGRGWSSGRLLDAISNTAQNARGGSPHSLSPGSLRLRTATVLRFGCSCTDRTVPLVTPRVQLNKFGDGANSHTNWAAVLVIKTCANSQSEARIDLFDPRLPFASISAPGWPPAQALASEAGAASRVDAGGGRVVRWSSQRGGLLMLPSFMLRTARVHTGGGEDVCGESGGDGGCDGTSEEGRVCSPGSGADSLLLLVTA